ncbi:ribonuclease Z [Flavobacterium aurantiibacter]|uniref:Ribonuclease Z n=1 Tax=Flavobacterium aurantiibacter TaxID=2023067 RepID=A0A255ZG82_9FLAO|nr:ribonuclease Z [Flavobacterium aurantiibacter]OYQ39600.1 ribonuclease Z [Flavobacterium aurantiibacter]
MNLTILGCYAATPRTFSNPTSQVLEIRERVFLIDCAEGTQVALRKNKIKFGKINHIFISHLHGDHFYGLIGLISSFALLNRTTELHVYGPEGIKEVILLQLKLAKAYTQYPLHFHELRSTEPEIIFEDEKVRVSTIPLQHRVYTNGFLFEEKQRERKLNADALREFKVDASQMHNLKAGKDYVTETGSIIPNRDLTLDPRRSLRYAYCSDTQYFEELATMIQDVDVLYHESTFLQTEIHLCERTKHATAAQAAKIAKLAGVRKLILGHYSTRYDGIELFKTEAEAIFPDVHLADDGKNFNFEADFNL